MYNKYAETRYYEKDGPGSYELYPPGDRYIVGVSIQQSGTASESELRCNNTILAKNYGKDFPFNTISFYCNGAINVTKTGNDKAAFIITTIPKVNYEQIASPSALLGEINFSSQSAVALGNGLHIIWFGLCILILFAAINLGLYIYKK